MWFNVDIYRCARARANVDVPLPVLLLCPFASCCCWVYNIHCMHSAKEIARAILFKIQILSILTYIRNGGWECRFRTTYIHSHTLFSLPAVVSVFAAIWRWQPTTDNVCIYSIGFSGFGCRQRRHCHCRVWFRSKILVHTHLSTLIE